MRVLHDCVRIAFLAGVLLLPAPALALVLSVQGTVTKLLSYPPMGISVALGDPVSGTFRIDPATANCSGGGPCGTYTFQVGGVEIAGSLDSALATDSPPGSEDSLLIVDSDPDVPGFGCGDCLLVLEFRDASGTALSSSNLQAALLALPTWPGTMSLDTGNFSTLQEIQVTFDSVTLVSAATSVPTLPLPGALVIALAGAGLAALRGRRHRAHRLPAPPA